MTPTCVSFSVTRTASGRPIIHMEINSQHPNHFNKKPIGTKTIDLPDGSRRTYTVNSHSYPDLYFLSGCWECFLKGAQEEYSPSLTYDTEEKEVNISYDEAVEAVKIWAEIISLATPTT